MRKGRIVSSRSNSFGGFNLEVEADMSFVVGETLHFTDLATPWQPIETAPRDGTRIDVWAGGERVADVEWRHPDCCYMVAPVKPPIWCVQEPHYDETHWHEVAPAPTHWMPLPEPPK